MPLFDFRPRPHSYEATIEIPEIEPLEPHRTASRTEPAQDPPGSVADVGPGRRQVALGSHFRTPILGGNHAETTTL